jgi:hypothetical protein
MLITSEVHIMRESIALDGVLDLKWSRYSPNFEVLSREGPQRLDGVLDLKMTEVLT